METPRDLAFVTMDELTLVDLFTPCVTSVVQPGYDLGYRAAELLLSRIESRGEPQPEAASVHLPAAFKPGNTSARTGPARPRTEALADQKSY